MSSILRNSLAKFLEPSDENLTLSFCLDHAMNEAVQDCHCHPGVKGITDAKIEQMVYGPGYTEWKEDEV
jgi:hypothetical protein